MYSSLGQFDADDESWFFIKGAKAEMFWLFCFLEKYFVSLNKSIFSHGKIVFGKREKHF